MQFIKIKPDTTLPQLTRMVGTSNIDSILAVNGLSRTPDIGKQFLYKCQDIVATQSDVSWKDKVTMLNTMTGESEIFEQAVLASENDWKVLSAIGTFPNALKIPEEIVLPDSTDILGGSSDGVSSSVYKKIMDALMKEPHKVDESAFSSFSSMKNVEIDGTRVKGDAQGQFFTGFNLPWGKITLWSSLSNSSIDFPVYPEEVDDARKATYTEMPDTLYQYEPWLLYSNSGPRTQQYTFKMHRDMWSGNHLDGKANELIRFCQANCYPRYDGSAVNAPIVSLYIDGQLIISGRMTDVTTHYYGPIGQDNFYLAFDLGLSITEVSKDPLSYDSVLTKGLIG